MWRFCAQMNIIKGQRFYNTTYNEYNTIVLYSVLYTYNRTIEASLMPFQTRRYQQNSGATAEEPETYSHVVLLLLGATTLFERLIATFTSGKP